MMVLAIESSALTASAAVIEDGILKCEFTVSNKLTHSVTLLPIVKSMCEISGIRPEEADAIAVSSGPGSFTGLRIGAATAKGLALAWNRPVIRVSTLDSMGIPLSMMTDAFVCPLMDARRGQVYCAAYLRGAMVIEKSACDIREFLEAVCAFCRQSETEDAEYIFSGDGADVHMDTILERVHGRVQFAKAPFARQRAAHTAMLGETIYKKWLLKNSLTAEEVRSIGADCVSCFDDLVMDSDSFAPEYLRKSQAEREREAGLLENPGLHSLKKMQHS